MSTDHFIRYRHKQMRVMGPDSWPKEDQPRVFFTASNPTHMTLVRHWPWPGHPSDHISAGPGHEWGRHYPRPTEGD